jgi:ssDNA-binding Zn-finger/Zn-ribbon topoisomerase 1
MENILDLYVQKDGMREWMRSPFTNADKTVIFSTDGSAMVCINSNGVENDFENYEDKIEGIYPVGCSNCNVSISLEELQEALNKIKPVHVIQCPECDGDGVVEWTYENYTEEFECPVCNGNETIRTKENVFNERAGVKINGSVFYSNQIKRIVDTIILCGSTECTIVCKQTGMTVFKLSDDISVYQMEAVNMEHEVEI